MNNVINIQIALWQKKTFLTPAALDFYNFYLLIRGAHREVPFAVLLPRCLQWAEAGRQELNSGLPRVQQGPKPWSDTLTEADTTTQRPSLAGLLSKWL